MSRSSAASPPATARYAHAPSNQPLRPCAVTTNERTLNQRVRGSSPLGAHGLDLRIYLIRAIFRTRFTPVPAPCSLVSFPAHGARLSNPDPIGLDQRGSATARELRIVRSTA